ncbi:uncharacterized protein [Littorina saxatilis]|uniref:Sulfotransferase n=1 Tax=Littorina saxatilis TaxID=31220 RepID=A0AAN9BBM4_9CAEN
MGIYSSVYFLYFIDHRCCRKLVGLGFVVGVLQCKWEQSPLINNVDQMRSLFGSHTRRWPLMVVLALATLMLFYTSRFFSSSTLTFKPFRAALSSSWLKTVIYESVVSEYDVGEVSRWYRSSQCSGLQNVFVGDQPLYPPCQPDTPPGIPTLGRYPFVGPFPYVKKSKNPCWRQGGKLTCVPYFFLVGVSKSGTTDLISRINKHPDVISTVKEPHWFDRMRYHTTSYHFGAPSPQDFGVYTGHYTKVSAAVEKDIHTSGESVKICGDASPSQFYDNNEWPLYSGNEGCTEPRIILANHLHHLNPDVKIILIIRHPVERLYSRYLFDNQPPRLRRDPPSPEKFHNYVIDGLRKYRDCFNRWSAASLCL